MNTNNSVEQRLKRLEGELRIFRWAASLMAVALVSLVVMGLDATDDDKSIGRFRQIDTGHLVLRDADGQMRAWLGIAEGGPRLIFFDQSGQQRMGVGMTRQAEPALGIFDMGQNERVVLGIMEGFPGLVMRDPQGKKRTALFAREDWSSLFFYDKREVKRSGIGLFGEAAAVNLSDDRGRDRVGLTTDRKGSSLSFFDRGGQKRSALGLLMEDEPAFGFFTHEGVAQMALTVLKEKPEFNLYGTNGQEVAVSVMDTNGPQVTIFGDKRKLMWKAP
jgi:hypothetical protein